MFINRLALHYWMILMLSVVTAAVIGFFVGYQWENSTSSGNIPLTNQPDITGQILEQQAQQALTATTGADASVTPSELHSLTGYIRSLTPTSMTIEQTDATTADSDALEFTVNAATVYTQLQKVIKNELPETEENSLTYPDLHVDDIVTVYTLEDIRTAGTRVATKVQRLN